MSYILINTNDIVQNQYESEKLDDVKLELQNRVYNDEIILKTYNCHVENLYNSYIIYEIKRIPRSNTIKLIKKYTYNQNTNVYDITVLDDKNLKSDSASNSRSTVLGLSVSKDIKENLNGNPEENLEEKCYDDDKMLSEIERQLAHMKHLRDEKIMSLEEHKEATKAVQTQVINDMFNNETHKKEIKYKEETLEFKKKKFETDKETYKKIKNDIENEIFDEERIPSFFSTSYQTLKEMDNENTIDASDAFDIFTTKYSQIIKKIKDIKVEDDPYGIVENITSHN